MTNYFIILILLIRKEIHDYRIAPIDSIGFDQDGRLSHERVHHSESRCYLL